MIIDSRLELADAVSLNTGAAGTYLIGSQIDNGAGDKPVGAIDDLYLVILCQTGITAGSAGTIQFKLSSDASAAVATDGSATDHIVTKAHVTGTTAIAAGTVLACQELPKGFDYERYLGLLQITGTAAITAGKVDAFLTRDPARWAALDAPNQ